MTWLPQRLTRWLCFFMSSVMAEGEAHKEPGQGKRDGKERDYVEETQCFPHIAFKIF